MSSVYSSNRSSRRTSHVHDAPASPRRQRTSRQSRSSDVLPDLARHSRDAVVDPTSQVPKNRARRKSSQSSDVEAVSPVDAFNLDIVEAYEESDHEQCLSPAASDRPPRSSSLAHTSIGSRSISLDQNFREAPSTPVRRPVKGGSAWMDRPHPLKKPVLDRVTVESPKTGEGRCQLSPPLAFLSHDPVGDTFQRKHRRRMTISESKRGARNTIIVAGPTGFMEQDLPPMPGLSPSASTIASDTSLTPTTAMPVFPPSEDQIRRELEMMTLQDGAEPLVNHRYGGRANSDLIQELENEIESAVSRPSQKRQSSRRAVTDVEEFFFPDRTQLRRRKSIIEYFRKSPVDRLLDLYLGEDPPHTEKKPPDKDRPADVKRRASLARRVTKSLRHSKEKVPEVPPIPKQHCATQSQSHFDFD